ncbi:zinc ribbon domain-containing protein [Sporohalobacter salinus]|uniref:zinc ribbon domain-containing protein n=1 Tax=Sporohalobacter salinus TaxID=1494606 RepID=UPI001960E5F8|nr:C4-type zinc ribbon domain-containing protein [Sporohalobacter salinus]MBM7623200.1 putative nucleic acid-binding Zn-ribbon protein [Sporohalobacter salinus]
MIKLQELYRLQQIDKKINRLEEELTSQDLLAEQKKIEGKIDELKDKLAANKEQEDELKKKLKNKEFDNNRLEKQLTEYQEQLYDGESNAKELEQLQDKINEIKKQQSQLENEILDFMIELEEIEAKQIEINEKIENYQSKLDKLQQNYEDEQSELHMKLEGAKKNKRKLSEVIGDELIAEYQKLKERKHGLAVVELEDGYCMGCRVSLPAKLIENVRSGNEVFKCERCGRILYWNDDE